jgi:hypothetical protein
LSPSNRPAATPSRVGGGAADAVVLQRPHSGRSELNFGWFSRAVCDGRGVEVTVRTPAGASNVFSVDGELSAGELASRAVSYFVVHDQLEPGQFRLGLIRGNTIVDLAPETPLGSAGAGVVDGDVLHLLTSEPQVDGMALHPVLRDRMLDAEITVLEERLGGVGVKAQRTGTEVHITAPELGDDRMLVLDATRYDSEPVAVGITTASGTPVPGWRWPRALYRGEHPVLLRPFSCVQGTVDYHSHPSHSGDPWDDHRSHLRLADLVAHILRRCRQ